MRHFHLIDTAIGSDNIGDEIIVEQAKQHLLPAIQDAYITTSSGHDGLGPSSMRLIRNAQNLILLGTNALSATFRMRGSFMWHVEKKHVPLLKHKVVLMGVGANRDFSQVDRRQAKFLKEVLSPNHRHSVRDETAVAILKDCGVASINTSCPTLWSLDGRTPSGASRSSSVCFTLTKHKAHQYDADLLRILLSNYQQVWFWPQQPRDLDYMLSLEGSSNVRVLPANLAGYDSFLRENEVDVIGTRLHGTIRGLHNRRRSLAIAIDNRARDIGAETGLPVLARELVPTELQKHIDEPPITSLKIPSGNVNAFLQQFSMVS